MPESTILRVNSPHVVHETIDNETILMDLRTGNYYSIEWPGSTFWEYIAGGGGAEKFIEMIKQSHVKNEKEIINSIREFLSKLIKEGLLVEMSGSGEISAEISNEPGSELRKITDKLDKLQLNKYTDMQEMLLLDPIHDVDEKGWPEPKDKNE